MNNHDVARIAGRATAILLLLLSLNDLILSIPDIMAILHHWSASAIAVGEIYWVRYYLLFFIGHLLSAALMLYVANDLRQSDSGLVRYIAGKPSLPPLERQ